PYWRDPAGNIWQFDANGTPQISQYAQDQTTNAANNLAAGTTVVSVNAGDTLSDIVDAYNAENGTNYTWQDIAEFNGIADPNLIFERQEIVFPDGQNADSTSGDLDPTTTNDHPAVIPATPATIPWGPGTVFLNNPTNDGTILVQDANGNTYSL